MSTKKVLGWIDSHGGLWTPNFTKELVWGVDAPYENFRNAKAAGAIEVDDEVGITYLVEVGEVAL